MRQFGLRFDEPDETAFKHSYALRNITLDRLSLVFAAMLFYVFFLWDKAVDPVHWEFGHAVRGLLVLPALCLSAALLGLKRVQLHVETLLASLGVFCVIMLSLIYAHLQNGFDYAAVGPILVAIWVFSIFQIRFPYLLAFTLASILCFFAGQLVAGNARPGMLIVNALSIISGFGLGLWAAVLREVSHRRQFKLLEELAASRERIEDLLYSMLPREIVGRIQNGETAIADAYGEVSIVFADLVGFTELSRRITPAHLVELLNDLFSRFDAVAEREGVERIKTIGDAYMAVGGLKRETHGSDHAERAARFAFAIQRIARDFSERIDHPLNVRVGLHVGPVVAGVIGTKRPAFDCWGEAVNLASRLEGSASPGAIVISESAYWRLRDHFPVTVLDDLELKGIGPTKAYLLLPLDEIAAKAALEGT